MTGGSNASKNNNRSFSPRVLNLGTQLGGLGIGPTSWGPGNSIQAMFMAKRPSLQDAILEVFDNFSVEWFWNHRLCRFCFASF